MAYTKTTWSNGATALSAENFNHMEDGIETVSDDLDSLSAVVDTKVDKVNGKGLSTNDYTTAEKTKLSGISAGAEVNQNAFSYVKVGAATLTADSKQDTLNIVPGNNIHISTSTSDDSLTISASIPSLGDDYVTDVGVLQGGTYYRKWNSGIVECWIYTTDNVAIGPDEYGGGLYVGSWTWEFPEELGFILPPTVTCTHFKWGTSASWGTVSAATTSGATLRAIDAYARSSGSCVISAYAIGLWK